MLRVSGLILGVPYHMLRVSELILGVPYHMLRVSELMFLPAIVASSLIGLRIFVHDCALNILYFPIFMYFL
jgi:hypothetical protein